MKLNSVDITDELKAIPINCEYDDYPNERVYRCSGVPIEIETISKLNNSDEPHFDIKIMTVYVFIEVVETYKSNLFKANDEPDYIVDVLYINDYSFEVLDSEDKKQNISITFDEKIVSELNLLS